MSCIFGLERAPADARLMAWQRSLNRIRNISVIGTNDKFLDQINEKVVVTFGGMEHTSAVQEILIQHGLLGHPGKKI